MGDSGGFLDLPASFADPATAAISVIPVPYDETSTWMKGADDGPRAIIEASAAVEWLDVQTGTEVHKHGIATLDPVLVDGPPEELTRHVRYLVDHELRAGRLPVVLGGEHTVSIGAIQAAAALFDDLTVLQIDAHADTREEYDGSRHNHACVMARAREVCPIAQVGIRSLDASELERLDRSRVIFAHEIRDSMEVWIDRALGLLGGRVYVTIDLDAFDPSLVPATGTPEPGGLSWWQVDALLERVAAERTVVGFDVVELCPQPGQHASDFVAAKLVHRLMSLVMARRGSEAGA
jgi:agmatinase